ncbi:hypothetical protein AB0M79_23845 [Polymorphospora sp. NPDC051019]|uniref:hypothetical protein n=1 Tax=Polymorphospora sp. NPDC051019 TaxID=3155725 RepID=UPI0034225787
MSPSVAARQVGWLLRVNRRLGPDPGLRVGRNFAAAFRAEEPTRELAPSHVTRWESGQLAASRTVVARYERLLGLPADSLVVVTDLIMRYFSVPRPADRNQPGALPRPDEDRLYELLHRAEHPGDMTGQSWIELAKLVSGHPALVLFPETIWQRLAERLLPELMVSEGPAWLLRQEAMCRLLEHPVAGRFVATTCVDFARMPGSTAFVEPIALLDTTAQRPANDYLLGQLDAPGGPRSQHAAMLATIRKLPAGHFDAAQEDRLARSLAALADDATLTPDDRFLVSYLSRSVLRRRPRVEARVRNTLLAAGRHLSPDRPVDGHERVSHRIAQQAQRELDAAATDDDVLTGLVDELLFSPNTERRFLATMTISATPYRTPVIRAVLSVLRRSVSSRTGGIPVGAGLRTLTTLGTDAHRPLLAEILTAPGVSPADRSVAAWAAPHCAGTFPVHVWRQVIGAQAAQGSRTGTEVQERIMQGLVYGIGTDRHHDLLADLGNDPTMPESARATASWLLRTPPSGA